VAGSLGALGAVGLRGNASADFVHGIGGRCGALPCWRSATSPGRLVAHRSGPRQMPGDDRGGA